jgi:hypothetical protein
MAHGIAGTRDSGLLPYAEAFAEAGIDALLFDYRNFGDSSGEPRQIGWPERHRQDYHAAIEFARGLDGVDPDRIALWGTSWAGGHVVYVAADDSRIAAVISQTPDMDGIAVLREIARHTDWRVSMQAGWAGLKDLAEAARGRPPHLVPVVGPPGTLGVLTTPDAEPGYREITGPTWRNEVSARALIAEIANRPITRMEKVACPILVQIADRDSVAPPAAARAAAWRAKGRVEVREYPCLHFQIYLDEWRERAIADQLHFLSRHLAPSETREPARLS